MKKKFILSAMLVLILALGFVFVSCDDGGGGGGGGGGDTYTVYADGLTTSEWNSYVGSNIYPDEVFNQSYSTAEVNALFASFEALALVHYSGQTEAQLRTLLSSRGIVGNERNSIINKLKSQGWVCFAIQPPLASFDYADLIGIRKE